jgi:acetolactate synthase-1/2/3 large subunit
MDRLSDLCHPTDIILTGNALDSASAYQALRLKPGQRSFTNCNYGAMGWDLPAAVGAAVAAPDRRVILVTGDGSFQFNIQELLTIGHHRLNVKVFVLNNRGYESIRVTHTNFFGRVTAADPSTGVSNPDYRALAAAHGLAYARAATHDDLTDTLPHVLASDGPLLCELNIAYDQARSPKATSYRRPDGTIESKPLEDMWPFLPSEEVWHNMHMFDDDNP